MLIGAGALLACERHSCGAASPSVKAQGCPLTAIAAPGGQRGAAGVLGFARLVDASRGWRFRVSGKNFHQSKPLAIKRHVR